MNSNNNTKLTRNFKYHELIKIDQIFGVCDRKPLNNISDVDKL